MPSKDVLNDVIRAVLEQDAGHLALESEAVIEEWYPLRIVRTANEGVPLIILGTAEARWSDLFAPHGGRFSEGDSAYILLQTSPTRRFALDATVGVGPIQEEKVVAQRYKEGAIKSYLWFSLPVISTDHKHAYVIMGHVCGRLCGSGTGYWLHNWGEGWRVVDNRNLWVS